MANRGFKNTRGTIIEDYPEKTEQTWVYDINKRNGLDPSKISSGCKTIKALLDCDICPDKHKATPYNWFVRNQRECRRSSRVTDDNCIFATNSDLAEEIDEAHSFNITNGITSKTIKAGHNGSVFWKCNQYLQEYGRICGHSWHASPNSRKKNGCPACSGRVATPENNLGECFPEVAGEVACPAIDTKTIPPKSSEKLFFRCPANKHKAYEMRVYARTSDGQGCPECYSRVSKLQLRFTAEAMYIWGEDEVEINHKINGDEIDVITLPSLIGTEFDGYRWHKENYERDVGKFQRASMHLKTLLNVREEGLEKITNNDVWYSKGEDDLAIVMRIFQRLIEISDLGSDKKKFIAGYISEATFKNEKKYRLLLKFLKAPPPGKSLGEKHLESLVLWDYVENSPLTPYDVYASSGDSAYFKCPLGVHASKLRIISNFVKCLESDTKGCGDCYGNDAEVSRENSFGKYCETAIGWKWDVKRNGDVDPYTVPLNSGKEYYFICSWCSASFADTPDNRTRVKGFGCKICHHENGKYHLNNRDSQQLLNAIGQ